MRSVLRTHHVRPQDEVVTDPRSKFGREGTSVDSCRCSVSPCSHCAEALHLVVDCIAVPIGSVMALCPTWVLCTDGCPLISVGLQAAVVAPFHTPQDPESLFPIVREISGRHMLETSIIHSTVTICCHCLLIVMLHLHCSLNGNGVNICQLVFRNCVRHHTSWQLSGHGCRCIVTRSRTVGQWLHIQQSRRTHRRLVICST